MENISQKDAATILKQGGIGVLATDTLYGLVGCALSKKTVERIYRVRKRNPKKPCIILIHSLRDCARFGVKADARTKQLLSTVWPGKVSVILPCAFKKFTYLHRGTNTLAFRMPKNILLRQVLQKIGPLIAPSANIEGMSPATTITEAKKYFSKTVDFYMNAGKRVSAPSTLIAIEHGRIIIKRQGAVNLLKSHFGHPQLQRYTSKAVRHRL